MFVVTTCDIYPQTHDTHSFGMLFLIECCISSLESKFGELFYTLSFVPSLIRHQLTNAISTIIIHGLLEENGPNAPLSFYHFDLPPVTPTIFNQNVDPRSRHGLPVPTPSLSLPSPGDLSIRIMLAGRAECLKFGLKLTVEGCILSSTPGISVPSVPPLSMRIAATRALMLEKEAWFYECLQILQVLSR